MTDLRKAADMALYALENNLQLIEDYGSKEQLNIHHKAILALYKTLAQPEQEPFKPDWVNYRQGVADGAALEQQPVAWMLPDYGNVLSASEADGTGIYNIPLFTAPPKREWVGLTEDEIKKVMQQWRNGYIDIKDVEQLLKDKNK
jgi:hypothetical protein